MSNLFRENIYKIINENLQSLTSSTKDFNEINLEIIRNEEVDIYSVIKLFFSDYVIFLTSKYFFFNFDIFSFKKNLLKYFEKYDVVYLNYSHKNKIINLINILNIFIKNSSEKVKINFLNILIEQKQFNDIVHKNIKEIYFNDNNIEPTVLYKKILFSNQELFLPFDNYVIKRMEYKLRTFCQIAEKLGAEKIVIEYNNSVEDSNNTSLKTDSIMSGIGGNVKGEKTINNSIQIVFEYPNNTYDINLNKYYIINSILNENNFMITKKEFEADLELKFLIDARCINLIQKYHTNFIINHMNRIEQKIFMKASKYGLDIEHSIKKNENTKISIKIDFIPLHNNYNIIDGTNVHVLREGFVYLANIIKKDENSGYNKLLGFLKSHLSAIEKKWIELPYNYDHINIINKIYHSIFNLNFKPNETEIVLRKYFENNLTWDTFEKFRDLILKGSDIELDKLHFVTFQLFDILNFKKGIVDKIHKYFNEEYNIILNKNLQSNQQVNQQSNQQINDENNDILDIQDIETMESYIDDSFSFENYEKNTYKNSKDFFIHHKHKITGLIITSFKKSFYFKGGLSDNVLDIELLIRKVKNIVNFYFDYEYKYLQQEFQSCVINKDNLIFNDVIDGIIDSLSNKIISNNNYKKNNTTPKLNNNNEQKISLLLRQKKIFINFLMKYSKLDKNIVLKKIFEKEGKKFPENLLINNNVQVNIKNFLINNLNKLIPTEIVYKNYSKYKLFYTWDNLLEVSLYLQ